MGFSTCDWTSSWKVEGSVCLPLSLMGPKLLRLGWIWMYLRWIINVVLRFVFCLALPEVIHLPHGLGAVTRNWRNHNCMELSAPQSPGEESDGAHCSTKRWEHFLFLFFGFASTLMGFSCCYFSSPLHPLIFCFLFFHLFTSDFPQPALSCNYSYT